MTGMTYEQFGSAFVHAAVTPERVSSVVRQIAGDVVSVGPMPAGPGGMATATATGTLADPVVEQTTDEPLGYLVTLHVSLDIEIAVGGGHHHYTASGEIRIRIGVRLEPPLSICVEPAAPTPDDVSVTVQAKGLQAKLVGRVGDIDNEIRRETAAYVKQRIEAEASQFADVDLLPLIAQAMPTA